MYKGIGYQIKPEGEYIPSFAASLINRGDGWESMLRDFVMEIGEGKGNTRLKNLLIHNVFAAQTEDTKPGTEMRTVMMHLVIKLLAHAGYIDDAVPVVQRVLTPIMTIDDVARAIVSADLRYPSSTEMGGDYATVTNFIAVATHTLSRIAFVLDDNLVARTVTRLRTYVGHIGFKIKRNEAISQEERTFFMLYRSTAEGTPGYSKIVAQNKIAARETADPLVLEAFRAATQVGTPGPFWRFFKLSGGGPMEQFSYCMGFVPPRLTTMVGYSEPNGPFSVPRYETLDDVAWSFAEQVQATQDMTDYIGLPRNDAGFDSLRPIASVAFGFTGDRAQPFILDDPGISLRLPDENDVSKIIWGYTSMFAERPIDSSIAPIDVTDYLSEVAWRKKTYGANEFLQLDPTQYGLADYSEVADAFSPITDATITERIYAPSRSGSRTLEAYDINMADYYMRRGTGFVRSLFAEVANAPRSWFMQPDENAFLHIAGRLGLTREEMVKYKTTISISHQVARWRRLTGNEPTINDRLIISALTGLPIA